MNWVRLILLLTVFAIAALAIFYLLNRYVLSKIKVNKWVIFGASMIMLILPSILTPITKNFIWQYICSFLFVILFLWFLESSKLGRMNSNVSNYAAIKANRGKKDVKIRPKAKPNRVKNKE